MAKEVISDKVIRKWGDSLVIVLDKQDIEILGVKENDQVNLLVRKKENV